jgi:hypothetical protein
MTLITTLTLVYETKDNAHYAESPGEDESSLLGTVSVQKWALPKPTPSTIRLSLEPYGLERPGHRHRRGCVCAPQGSHRGDSQEPARRHPPAP